MQIQLLKSRYGVVCKIDKEERQACFSRDGLVVQGSGNESREWEWLVALGNKRRERGDMKNERVGGIVQQDIEKVSLERSRSAMRTEGADGGCCRWR